MNGIDATTGLPGPGDARIPETYLLAMQQVVAGYSNRLLLSHQHEGPALGEHEFCLYVSACRLLEMVNRRMAEQIEKHLRQPEDC